MTDPENTLPVKKFIHVHHVYKPACSAKFRDALGAEYPFQIKNLLALLETVNSILNVNEYTYDLAICEMRVSINSI